MECTHRFQVDSQNIGTCSLCGEVRQFPYEKGEPVVVLKKGSPIIKRRRKAMHRHEGPYPERHRYYEGNKEVIVADLLSKGKAYTRKRWKIPRGSLGKLIQRWLTEEQKLKIPVNLATPPGTPGETPHPSTNSTHSNGRLPPFPPFSDTWEPEVQLAWIDAYRELAKEST